MSLRESNELRAEYSWLVETNREKNGVDLSFLDFLEFIFLNESNLVG